ncbi:MAG TPA: hypothetical protein DCM05_01205, partial [Elusimicrobia bacterium]|nr:hypothetical protein [Elusimicrobiota bacterium]
VVRPEEPLNTAVFSFPPRLTFVEDGSIAWSGSGSGQAEYGTVQGAAETAVKKTADKLFKDILKEKAAP